MQGWEEVDGTALQVCAACNLAWLDTTFQLAPEAGLESGNSPHLVIPEDYLPVDMLSGMSVFFFTGSFVCPCFRRNCETQTSSGGFCIGNSNLRECTGGYLFPDLSEGGLFSAWDYRKKYPKYLRVQWCFTAHTGLALLHPGTTLGKTLAHCYKACSAHMLHSSLAW